MFSRLINILATPFVHKPDHAGRPIFTMYFRIPACKAITAQEDVMFHAMV
jgi:hypothetical protein